METYDARPIGVAEDRRTYLAGQRERHGRRGVAALPIEHPRELATALGRVTVELWGPPGVAPGRSQAWLPSFACPLARNALEWILRGEAAAAADLLVVPHACDSLQALAAQVIDLGAGSMPAVTFYPPRHPDPAQRAAFLRAEIARYRAAVEAVLGPASDPALTAAVALHGEADRLARRLLDEGPREGWTEAERYALLRRREWTWVEDQIGAFREALARPRVPPDADRRLPILLSGIVPEPPGLVAALEAAGLRPAADDLAALGRRLPERFPDPTGDPMEDLARRHEALPPCSTRTNHPTLRTAHLLRRAAEGGVRGAVFVVVARCEPELFDLPAVREALRSAGVPSVVVETEMEAAVPAAMVTRLEAFAESLRDAVSAPVPAAPEPPPAPTPRSLWRALRHRVEGRWVGPWAVEGASLRRRLRRPRPPAPGFGPPLRANEALRRVLERYYLEGRTADGGRPVAWVTSGAPVEILRPLDYYVVYPENHAAICGARHRAQGLCEAAEAAGHSRALCSYARTDIGAWLSGKTPVGRIPRPDLLVACGNICQTVIAWYRTLARETGAELVVIDTPFLQGGLRPHHVPYVRRQIEALAEAAERVARRPLRPAALERTLSLAMEASFLWGECLATARARPAPFFGLDAFLQMAPIVVLRGTESPVHYYRELAGELRERVRRGVGGLAEERVRLLWDNLPIWPELRRLSEFLASRRANLVATTYTHAWADCTIHLQAGDPFEGLARTYADVLLNRDLADRAAGLIGMARRYGAHGALFHADRSCRPYSLGEHGLRDRLARRHGVPGLVIEADHSDPRDVAWEALETRLDAFLESLPEASAPAEGSGG